MKKVSLKFDYLVLYTGYTERLDLEEFFEYIDDFIRERIKILFEYDGGNGPRFPKEIDSDDEDEDENEDENENEDDGPEKLAKLVIKQMCNELAMASKNPVEYEEGKFLFDNLKKEFGSNFFGVVVFKILNKDCSMFSIIAEIEKALREMNHCFMGPIYDENIYEMEDNKKLLYLKYDCESG